ncbi:cation:proton antiporter [Kocuria sp. NPDC057446]|uniref:cation:proton antiporter n=1 Tax=Kocuria sp. NPDC057446 TaxID=3346137 RepID=UPI00367FA03D
MTVHLALDLLTTVLVVAGTGFFTIGTIGLLRLPDLRTRLHALTKADNLGLGLVVAGLVLQTESVGAAAKLLVIWSLAMLASPVVASLLARREGLSPAARAADGPAEEAPDG